MHVLNVTTLPIYLPADTAQIPFGDPLNDITITSSSTGGGVITSPGYVPTLNDRVSFSVDSGGTIAGGLTAGVVYYVVTPVNNTFQVATTAGGTPVNTTSSNSAAGQVCLHLMSAQFYGTRRPFKSGGSAVVLNLTGGALVLQGAMDVNATAGNPGGPGAYTSIASVAAGGAVRVNINYDWISLVSSGTLVLLQN